MIPSVAHHNLDLKKKKKSVKKNIWRHAGIFVFLVDSVLLGISFFTAVYLKTGSAQLSPQYRILLGIFYAAWLLASLLSNRFRLKRHNGLLNGFSPVLRAFLYLAFLILFLHFLFQMFFYSRFVIFLTLISFIFLEILAYGTFLILRGGGEIEVIEEYDPSLIEGNDVGQEEDAFIDKKGDEERKSLFDELKNTLADEYPKVFEFIGMTLDLENINIGDSLMLDTEYFQAVSGVMNNKLKFIGNICRINDIRKVNKYFMAANRKLVPGGYFYGVVETLKQRLKRKLHKCPKFSWRLIYMLDFFWTRLIPTLPVLKKIFYLILRKETRIISKCEILGRLQYCGFKIVKYR